MILRGSRLIQQLLVLSVVFFVSAPAVMAQKVTIGEKVDSALAPVSEWFAKIIFVEIPIMGEGVPVVLIILAGTALFLSVYFRFINLRLLGLAFRTVRGKYFGKEAPGQITHFQALSTALSATVGLGNIAGVAIAIGIGGPGAVFWMIIMGFLGMTSKFTECTLGVKYRKIEEDGTVHGGGMFYLRDGLKERGLGGLGKVLAIIFAIACIGGALGAGNMFQINQAHAQVSETFNVFNGDGTSWMFGVIVAALVGLVIIGGIVWIARVTEFLVPFMCVTYVLACVVVLLTHASDVPSAFATIVTEAFAPTAAAGGFIGGLIQGIRRGVFSNEAGVGSAAIAHSPVKTTKPASEGVVALLEPFVDTVVVCTMTALVIVVTGMWKVDADVKADNLTLLGSPAEGAAQVVAYEKGEMVKLKGHWIRATTEGESGQEGWVAAGEVAQDENEANLFAAGKKGATLLKNPDPKADPLAKLAKGGKMRATARWTKVFNPKDEKEGWVLAASFKKGENGQEDWVATNVLTERSGTGGGIWLTSQAFKGVISWFPKILAIAVFLFAFSTMISWSYYGEQALGYLTGENRIVAFAYKLVFCLCVVIGSAASLGNILDISDSLFFAMVVPNVIGLFILLPVVKRELEEFRRHAAEIDAKGK